MNFKEAIKSINKDFCNLFYAKYLKGAWGITVGYRTLDGSTAIMRKQLADWQLMNDCNDDLCAESNAETGDFTLNNGPGSYQAGECVLNPPLSAYGHGHRHCGYFNVNEILIGNFTR